jgi:hypothetical protein
MYLWPPTMFCCGACRPPVSARAGLGITAADKGLVRPEQALAMQSPAGRGCTGLVPAAEDGPAVGADGAAAATAVEGGAGRAARLDC